VSDTHPVEDAQAHNQQGRKARDRGSVLVEAAIVLPLLFSLLFGVLEIGGALKSYSSASNAVRAGGRMASVAGNDAMADQAILSRVAQEAAGLGKGEIEYIIIWKATGPGTKPPAACIAAAGSASSPNTSSLGVYDGGTGQVGACNVYVRPDATGGAFAMANRGPGMQPPEYYFGCTGPSGPGAAHMVDCRWSPKNRKVAVSPRGTPAATTLKPDHLGVYIRATHKYYTGMFGSTLTISDSGINLLEPDTYQVGTGS
jgi:hypothetical protein